MRVSLLILFIFLSCETIFAQSTDFFGKKVDNSICPTEVETDNDKQAIDCLNKICDAADIPNNFILVPCTGAGNCLAIFNNGVSYIVYDKTFLNKVKSFGFTSKELPTNVDWVALTIFAHELGHHLCQHLSNYEKVTAKYKLTEIELQADEYAGTILYKLGATLEQAQKAFRGKDIPVEATLSHPARKDRLTAIAKGYNKYVNRNNSNNNVNNTVTIPEGPMAIVKDYFVDNKNNWEVSSKKHVITISDNRMIYENNEKKDKLYTMLGIPISLKSSDDFTVEVSIQSLTPCENEEINSLLAILQSPKPVYYGFAIGDKKNNILFAIGSDIESKERKDNTVYTCKPGYFITSMIGGNIIYLQKWMKSNAISDGGNVNILKLIKTGDTFSFYVNNRLVSTKNAFQLSNENSISITSSANSKVSINYVKVYKTS